MPYLTLCPIFLKIPILKAMSASNDSPSHNKATQVVTALNEQGLPCQVTVAEEIPLTLVINQHPWVTLMTLGHYPIALGLGYLRNQRQLQHLQDLDTLYFDQTTQTLHLTILQLPPLTPQLATGCAQGNTFLQLPPSPLHSPIISDTFIHQILQTLTQHNPIYRRAGGVHGCALFQDQQLLVFVEDISRHNAVDTIGGLMWLNHWTGQDKIFYTTGRLTTELVMKVANLQIPILLSRSGISYRSIQLAQQTGMIIIANIKEDHFLIFSGQHKITF